MGNKKSTTTTTATTMSTRGIQRAKSKRIRYTNTLIRSYNLAKTKKSACKLASTPLCNMATDKSALNNHKVTSVSVFGVYNFSFSASKREIVQECFPFSASIKYGNVMEKMMKKKKQQKKIKHQIQNAMLVWCKIQEINILKLNGIRRFLGCLTSFMCTQSLASLLLWYFWNVYRLLLLLLLLLVLPNLNAFS